MKKFRDKQRSQSMLLKHGIARLSLLLLSLLSMSGCATQRGPSPCPVVQPPPADLMQPPTYRAQWDRRVGTTSDPTPTTSSTKPTPK